MHSDNYAHVKSDVGGMIDACTSSLIVFLLTQSLPVYRERAPAEASASSLPSQHRRDVGLRYAAARNIAAFKE